MLGLIISDHNLREAIACQLFFGIISNLHAYCETAIHLARLPNPILRDLMIVSNEAWALSLPIVVLFYGKNNKVVFEIACICYPTMQFINLDFRY